MDADLAAGVLCQLLLTPWRGAASAVRGLLVTICRSRLLKILSFLNWIALGVGALMTLLYAVVCLMMLPYPQLVSDAGGGFDQVVQITLVLAVFTAAAGLSTRLLQKRHRALWLGQGLLVVALAILIIFALMQR